MARGPIMSQPPTYTTWKITCQSPEDAAALQQWLASHIDLDRVLTDTVRTTPGGVEQVETVRHRLGDYFSEIRVLPSSAAEPTSFRIVFHRKPEGGRFWKDLMVSILREIETTYGHTSLVLESKAEMEPIASAAKWS